MGSSYTAPPATVYPLAGAWPIRVLLIGDSMTVSPLPRRALDRYLRQELGDVIFVGDKGLDATTGGIIGSTDMSSWAHAGVSGNTLAQMTARVDALATALGTANTPHVTVLTGGTNDASAQRALADILADKRTLIDRLRLRFPRTTILDCSIANWRSGSASGGSWAAKKALRDAYNAALPGVAKAYGRAVRFVDAYGGQPPAEISSDGVHPIEVGYRRWADRVARAIIALTGETRQRRRPLIVHPRAAQAALSFATATNDRVTFASDTDLAPEAQSFAATCWVRFTDVTGATPTPRTIIGFGPTGGFPDGWALAHQYGGGAGANGFSVYVDSATPVIAGTGGYSGAVNLQVGQDYHVAVVCDRASNRVGLAVNGATVVHSVDLLATAHPGANWNIPHASGTSLGYFGKFVVNGMLGLLKQVHFYKGAGSPAIEDLGRFAEMTYADGLIWSGRDGTDETALSAYYALDEGTGSPAEGAGRTANGTVNGAVWGTW